MLSYISKQIIYNRLLDRGITIDITQLDYILINSNDFPDYDSMYSAIVNNWNKLIIN